MDEIQYLPCSKCDAQIAIGGDGLVRHDSILYCQKCYDKLEAERVRLRECIEMILIPALTAATGKPEYLGRWNDDIAIANLVLKETGDCKQALEEK